MKISSGVILLQEFHSLPCADTMAGHSMETESSMEEEYLITIKLTEEKEEAIKAFFAHNNWDFVKLKTVKCDKKRKVCSSAGENSSRTENDSDPEFQQPTDPNLECRYCLLTPCVTLKTYSWEGRGQRASGDNAGIRHNLYKKYWWVIANRGGWNDERYIERKRTVGEGEWAVTHRREVMPLCVLKKTRSKYPNTVGQPYLGHKWE